MYPKSRKGVEPGPCDKKESQQLAADEYQYGAPTQSNAEAAPLVPAQWLNHREARLRIAATAAFFLLRQNLP